MFKLTPTPAVQAAHHLKRSVFSTLFGLLVSAALPVWSQEVSQAAGLPSTPAITWHGFGTLGAVRTTNDQVQFVRDLTQPHGAGKDWNARVDSLLGIQTNVRFSPETEGVLQAVSRFHSDGSYHPELSWAFLRHDFSPDVSLRAGRLGTEFFMLGDSRLVGYANQSVRPPSDFYGPLVFTYIDGADVSVTLPMAAGLLKAKLFAGLSPEKASFAYGIEWDQKDTRLIGGYLDFQKGPWQVRLSHAQVKFAHELPMDDLLRFQGDPLSGIPYLSLVPEMRIADKMARFSSLGLVYDQGPLNVQLMFNQIKYDSPAYANSKAGYLMAGYRLGAVTPYVGVSRTFADVVPIPGSPIPGIDAITESLVSHSYTDHHTYTLGGRWDVQKNVAVKAQLDWVRGKPTSVFVFKDDLPGWGGRMTVLSLALDFVF